MAPFIIGVLSENSDITANAFTGRGGNINITTNGIFGLRFQPELTPNSDITASSEFGLSGSVILNLLAIDPSQGLVSLPINLVDPSNQISQACQPGRGQTASSFVTTGRGGIPKNPEQPLKSPSVVTPWVAISSTNHDDRQELSTASPTLPDSSSSPILEAQGWQTAGDGTIHLVANPPTSSPHGLGFAPVVCP
jgi:large exoprotein involved in heme utilization and adhesion